MAAIINTNIQSLTAQRNLSVSQNSLATSMQRLSSGLRINSAKDDAAGLAISERMTTQIRGLNQAARNANDGISLSQTAEGALGTIGNNLQRIRELAVQSRNATNSSEDRAALQKEVSQLKSEIDRVSKDTAFNGTKLLDGSFTAKAFQAGANQGEVISVDKIVDAGIKSLGEWSSVIQPAAPVSAARPTGTAASAGPAVAASTTIDAAGFATSGVNNWNINGTAVSFNTGTGAAAAVGNLNTKLGELGLDASFTASTTGTDIVITANSAGTMVPPDVTGYLAAGAATKTPGTVAGDKVFAAADFKINNATIKVDATVGDTNRVNDLVKAINKETANTGVTASVSDGKLKLETTGNLIIEAGALPSSTTAAMVLTETGLTLQNSIAAPAAMQKGFDNLDISTVEGSDNAILAMDAALKAVNSARADLGAIQNRFEAVVSNLNVNSENLSASRSRIMDADFAQETANLSRSQILQQAGTAMVAQANQLPQSVLKLLQ